MLRELQTVGMSLIILLELDLLSDMYFGPSHEIILINNPHSAWPSHDGLFQVHLTCDQTPCGQS